MLVSDTPLDVLLPRLRELGAAPVVEARRRHRPDRAARPGPGAHARAGGGPRPPRWRGRPRQAAQVVAPIRAGDRVDRGAAGDERGHAHAQRLAGRAARRGREPTTGAHRLRRQPRHPLRTTGRAGPGRGRAAHGVRRPQRRHPDCSRSTGSPRCATPGTRPRPGRRLDTWTSSGMPRRRRACSTPSSPTATTWWRHLIRRQWLHAAVRPTATRPRCAGSRRSCGRSSRRPTAENVPGVIAGLNALMEKHPITPMISDHDPADLHLHVATRAATVVRAAHRRGAARPRRRSCATSDRPGSASARRRSAHKSTSTPRPTSRAATAPTAAPRAPTSPPTAPARRPSRLSDAGRRDPAAGGRLCVRRGRGRAPHRPPRPGPALDGLVDRRAAGEPLEHLLGWASFAGLGSP